MQRLGFNNEWRFHLGDFAKPFQEEADDSSWRVVDLPHDWSVELDRDPKNISGNSWTMVAGSGHWEGASGRGSFTFTTEGSEVHATYSGRINRLDPPAAEA